MPQLLVRRWLLSIRKVFLGEELNWILRSSDQEDDDTEKLLLMLRMEKENILKLVFWEKILFHTSSIQLEIEKKEGIIRGIRNIIMKVQSQSFYLPP